MDEIDAALDFRNVSIVANYIKDRTKNAQFIIISLRWVCSCVQARDMVTKTPLHSNDMFELSHRLIGIYKTANATRSEKHLAIDCPHALLILTFCRYLYRQPRAARDPGQHGVSRGLTRRYVGLYSTATCIPSVTSCCIWYPLLLIRFCYLSLLLHDVAKRTLSCMWRLNIFILHILTRNDFVLLGK